MIWMPSDHSCYCQAAVEGTLNVVVQAEKAGVKRVVVTSSIVTVMNPKGSFTDQGMCPRPRCNSIDTNLRIPGRLEPNHEGYGTERRERYSHLMYVEEIRRTRFVGMGR
jgi:nucleoside-diphosphate-sugar epimerase